ncbi:MAG TPA: hypothetical protein VFM58_01455 [Solirubrobacteraceae bacterium]|nr:hypothetical protein [Solirubrobacteraceae bacterium]
MHEIQAMTIVDQLVAELALGRARSVAFVVPSDATQTAPLYDVAIATARRGWMIGLDDVRYWFVTPEPEPVSRAAAARLEPEGIVFVGSTYPEVRHGRVLLDPQGESIEVDLVVGLCPGGAEASPAEPLGVGSAHGSRSPEPVRPVALAA